MTQPSADVLLRIERLLRIGRQEEAQLLLMDYLKVNPSSARGWWLMSLTVPDLSQQRDCLERVLQLDPDDELARERLEMLKTQPPPPAAVKPFTALDFSETGENPENAAATLEQTAPLERSPEGNVREATRQEAPPTPAWAVPEEALLEHGAQAFPPEPGTMPEWAAPSGVFPHGGDPVGGSEPGPLELLDRSPIPVKPPTKWWLLDLTLAVLALAIIGIFIYYLIR